MRVFLLAGVAILTCVSLAGCDQMFGTKTAQQVAASGDCHCQSQAASPPEHLMRLAPPENSRYRSARRYRHRYAAYDERYEHRYAQSSESSETFVARSYSSASGSYDDAENGYGSGDAYDGEGYASQGWRRPPEGRGYWIDGYNRAHYISRNAELAAANASNMAINSGANAGTWFGYDKDCPQALGQDGY